MTDTLTASLLALLPYGVATTINEAVYGTGGGATSSADGWVFTGADANWTIDATGNGDTITVGNGVQMIYATGIGDNITIQNGVAPNPTMLWIGSNANVFGGNGNVDIWASGNSNTVLLANGNDLINALGQSANITIGNAVNAASTSSGGSRWGGGCYQGGWNGSTCEGSGYGFHQVDWFSNSGYFAYHSIGGSGGHATGCYGGHTIFNGGCATVFSGGTQVDGSVIQVAGAATVTTGDGNNSVIAGGNSNFIAMGNGSETVTASGSFNTIIVGNNTGAASTISINNDSTVVAGNGTNWITASGGGNQITVGSGSNTITFQNCSAGGNNQIQLTGGSNVVFLAGSGDTVYDGTGSDTIVAGTGTDTFQANAAGGSVSITGFGATDTLDLSSILAGLGLTTPTAAGLASALTVVEQSVSSGCGGLSYDTIVTAHGLGGTASFDLHNYNGGGFTGMLSHILLPTS